MNLRACDRVRACGRPSLCGLPSAAGRYGDLRIGPKSEIRALRSRLLSGCSDPDLSRSVCPYGSLPSSQLVRPGPFPVQCRGHAIYGGVTGPRRHRHRAGGQRQRAHGLRRGARARSPRRRRRRAQRRAHRARARNRRSWSRCFAPRAVRPSTRSSPPPAGKRIPREAQVRHPEEQP